MATSRPSSLRAFLAIARRSLQQHLRSGTRQHNSPRLNLVVGNESADLDSITSAIVYAYFKSHNASIHVPILNIPHEDVRIRPELLKVLPHVGVEENYLITLDDLDFSSPSLTESTSLTLVDHNKPVGPFSALQNCVTACIDHHVDENTVPKSANPRIITLDSGSCTSLIIQHIRPLWDDLSLSASSSGVALNQDDTVVAVEDVAMRRGWDAQIAKLALASILIDTHDLEDASKTREVDREAVKYLTARIDLAPPGKVGGVFDRKKFFEEIREAKGDLSGLSVSEVLRKDYKEFDVKGRKLGISSVVKPLEWLVGQAAGESADEKDAKFADEFKDFVTKKQLDVYAIMTAATHGLKQEFQRELLVWMKDPSEGVLLPAGWMARLEDELKPGDLEQSKERIENMFGDSMDVKAWRQHDVSKSRKQVAPLLRQLMEEAQKT